LTEEKKLYFFN